MPAQRQFDSRTLFGEAQEVRITHFGQEYRLRQTRNGKLILTKYTHARARMRLTARFASRWCDKLEHCRWREENEDERQRP